jgi:protein-L-isoaspartate(D-aspartate) O-methyltransferase
MLKDSYIHKGLRKRLVEKLRKKGIVDKKILQAFLDIPRHYFLEDAFAEWAYQDKPFPIGCEQTISQPYTVAMQTHLLDVKKGDKILEIGTGSGFQAAVLHYLGARVYTIERFKQLFLKTTALLERMGFGGVRTFHGDGMKGLPNRAPYDKIIVTAGAAEIPKELLNQLAIGGIMIIPVGVNHQEMLKIIRRSETNFETKKHGAYRFVPLLGGKK